MNHVIGINRSAVSVGLAMALSIGGCADGPQIVTHVAPGEQMPVTAQNAGAYASVCHVRTRRWGLGKRGGTGTAVLYRGRYLITAGHNVYSPFYNRVTSIEVRCGVRTATGGEPDFRLTGGEWAAARGYSWRPYARDLGVIRLPRDVAGALSVELGQTVPGPGTVVEIAGYPGIGISDGNTLHSARGAVGFRAASAMPGSEGLIDYAVRTTTGNSGAPVWVRGADGGVQLVGIHVVGYGRDGGGARRVDEWFRSEVDRMIAVLDARARE